MKVTRVFDIFLETENGPLLEINWLMDNGAENVGVVKYLSAGTLLPKTDRGSLQDLGFYLIRLELNVEVPLLDLLRLSNHLVDLLNALDTVKWLLEETLPDLGHDALVFSNFGWNADQDAKFRRQVNVLTLLFDFEKWLLYLGDFTLVCLQEVRQHGDLFVIVSLIKKVAFWRHVPLDGVDFVSSLLAVVGHDYSAFEFASYLFFI